MSARIVAQAMLLLSLETCDALSIGVSRAPAHHQFQRSRVPWMTEANPAEEPENTPDLDVPEPEPVVEPEVEPVVEQEPEAVAAPQPAPEATSTSMFDDFGEEADEEGSIAKEALKAEVAEGLTGPRPDKAVVGEILLALEAQNPTRSPATSPLLNGKWKFLYASGASPGLKGLQLLLKGAKSAPKSPSGAELVDVRETFLTIKQEQPRAEASVGVRLLSVENTVKLSSKLEAESAVRLVETYEAAESEYMSLRLPFSSPVQYKRSVLISYLDEEMMVVRDSVGRPDVLVRAEDPTWASNEEDAPGAS